MSGGHFDHQQYRVDDIAKTIEQDIAKALQPKPDKVQRLREKLEFFEEEFKNKDWSILDEEE